MRCRGGWRELASLRQWNVTSAEALLIRPADVSTLPLRLSTLVRLREIERPQTRPGLLA
jgi:hypothetical protein